MAEHNDNWQQNLQDILAETEANITNLKRNMTPKFASTPFISRQGNYGTDEGLSGRHYQRASESMQRSWQSSDHLRPNLEVADKTASVVLNLSKRLEKLEMLTNSLSNSVVTLKYKNEVQAEEIKKLKGDVKHLTKRLSEKGVDLETEKKLKKWQGEVRSELEMIQSLMKTRKQTSEYRGLNDVTLVSLSKDISDSKRVLSEQTSSLRREYDHAKTRIVKLENEVALVTSESKDLGMRHMRLDKDMTSITESYRSYSRSFSKNEKENTWMKNELADMRRDVGNIQYELQGILAKKENIPKYRRSGSKDKSSSKLKDSLLVQATDKEFGTFFRKENKYSQNTNKDSFENSFDASLLSSEFDDLSLNTSLNLSDETDHLRSF